MLVVPQTQEQQQNVNQITLENEVIQPSSKMPQLSRPWLKLAVMIALLGAGVTAGSLVLGRNQGQFAPAVATLLP